MEDCVWEGDENHKQETTVNLQETEIKSERKGTKREFSCQVGAKLRRERISLNFFRSQLFALFKLLSRVRSICEWLPCPYQLCLNLPGFPRKCF